MSSVTHTPCTYGGASGLRSPPPLPRSRLVFWVGALALLGGCGAPAHTMVPSTAVPHAAQAVQSPRLPLSLLWFRHSAEYRALARQTYAMAAAHLEDTVPVLGGVAWGVILDADETILDNSEYERRRAALDSTFTVASWAKWTHEEAARAVPGAVAFTRLVHRMGGRVVVVSNRADSLCGFMRGNLRRLGVPTDLVLCQQPGDPDKNPRFERVEAGRASPTLPALRIVEWIGDNILDFPHMTQSVADDPSALSAFGRTFFVLPNPLYGSWRTSSTP